MTEGSSYMDRSRWRDEAEAITRGVAAIASGRRLAGLTISLPANVSLEEFQAILLKTLAGQGYPEVEVEARVRPGPIRMISAEFVR